jgi:hypothetical protein
VVSAYALALMADQHERYEQLAVGHVLGGLDVAAAADFRSHLLACRDCRSRVAELRGIAADLAAAERDERAQARVRLDTQRRVREDDEPPAGSRVGVRHVTVAAVLVVLLASAMAFWNLHLRTVASAYRTIADQRAETLEGLADGVVVDAILTAPIRGLVATDGERVALTLVGIPTIAPGEWLVAWLVGGPEGADPRPVLLVRSGQLDEDGALTTVLDAGGAQELLITRERGEPSPTPRGIELVRAPLRADPG